MSITLLVLFLILAAVGVPLAVALGIASTVTLVIFTQIPLSLVAQSMFSSMNSFIMVAVPLFVLAGMLMDEGG
ncbi:MAG TPA: TRAP transporter large permease subunit, partial [Firmicutes bacterium]|nr:TRAP transporter large permease subunit [Bacillota bacterium]